jgi:flagellar biosynthetic protein FliR
MNFTSAELTAWIGSFLWPLFRVGAMVGAAPILGARVVPMRMRLGLALVITLVIVPLLPAAPAVEPLSGAGLVITFNQLVIGLALGFSLRLVFSAIEIAGQIIGQLMGLGFASMIDPENGVQVPVVSQFYSICAMLMFLALNGHLLLIQMVADSFRTLPVSTSGIPLVGLRAVADWGGQMFAGAVLVALPAICALLLVNLAFGVMMRSAPQLNIFAVGFPITLLIGMLIMLVTLPSLPDQLGTMFDQVFGLMRYLIGGG